MIERHPDILTGRWHGLYTYLDRDDAGHFFADLVDLSGGVGGVIEEELKPELAELRRMRATVDGDRDGQWVSFVKNYVCGGWRHSVVYDGLMSPDRAEITGQWEIPGYKTGRFMMIRACALPRLTGPAFGA